MLLKFANNVNWDIVVQAYFNLFYYLLVVLGSFVGFISKKGILNSLSCSSSQKQFIEQNRTNIVSDKNLVWNLILWKKIYSNTDEKFPIGIALVRIARFLSSNSVCINQRFFYDLSIFELSFG